MNVQQPSIAARILTVIASASAPLNTTEIYALVDEAENQTLVSVTCRDLMNAGKVQRKQVDGRWKYFPRQLDLLADAPIPAEAEELARSIESPAAANKSRTHPMCGRRGDAGANQALKLRTLDKLIALLADDIAEVLRAVRKDVESLA